MISIYTQSVYGSDGNLHWVATIQQNSTIRTSMFRSVQGAAASSQARNEMFSLVPRLRNKTAILLTITSSLTNQIPPCKEKHRGVPGKLNVCLRLVNPSYGSCEVVSFSAIAGCCGVCAGSTRLLLRLRLLQTTGGVQGRLWQGDKARLQETGGEVPPRQKPRPRGEKTFWEDRQWWVITREVGRVEEPPLDATVYQEMIAPILKL